MKIELNQTLLAANKSDRVKLNTIDYYLIFNKLRVCDTHY
jgi:hypothetical protein